MTEPTGNLAQVKKARRYDAAGNRYCTGCKEFLPVDRFGPAPQTWDKLNVYCRPCQNIRVEAWRQRNLETARASSRALQARRRAANPELARARANAYNRALRVEVLAAYGNRCTCCGEATPEFLGLDHVNNDGGQHRKEVGFTQRIYAWARRNGYPDILQVHCHNCNLAKGFYGACPHQRPAS